jgi:hypothetical protein
MHLHFEQRFCTMIHVQPQPRGRHRMRLTDADMVGCLWNFKHIVHFDKIAGFNAVNIRLGYKALSIFSPKEVVEA